LTVGLEWASLLTHALSICVCLCFWCCSKKISV